MSTQPISHIVGLPDYSPLGIEPVVPRLARRDFEPLVSDVQSFATKTLLDRVISQMRAHREDVPVAMSALMSGLWSLRTMSTPTSWEQIIAQCVEHPLRDLLHQDPFTVRSFGKPRGYAGDAVMIDYIYTRSCDHADIPGASEIGRSIFAYNRDTPACQAVRARRDLVAAMIDQVAAQVDRPRILSVACGHLREASLCHSVRNGRVGRFVAIDQDQASLQVVEEELMRFGVVPMCNSIKALFRGAIADEKFDFIYSTGLYDYLDDRIATRLTSRLFDMLDRGGRLLLANFLPAIAGVGYMESFMNWRLIYRSAEQILELAAAIAPEKMSVCRTFVEESDNIIFLEIVRQ